MIEECGQLEVSTESEPSAVELSSLEEESGLETSEVESGSVAGENAVSTALEDLVPVEGMDVELIQIVNTLGTVGQGNDGENFREAVSSDESLKEWRELGKRCERGFSWRHELLVKSMYVTWDEFREVIVVPRAFRNKILEVAHDGTGHLGADKVIAIVNKHFLWPGMSKDIFMYCREKSKHNPKKVPVVEHPILSEPFEYVAVDIVGPLPKGRGG